MYGGLFKAHDETLETIESFSATREREWEREGKREEYREREKEFLEVFGFNEVNHHLYLSPFIYKHVWVTIFVEFMVCVCVGRRVVRKEVRAFQRKAVTLGRWSLSTWDLWDKNWTLGYVMSGSRSSWWGFGERKMEGNESWKLLG